MNWTRPTFEVVKMDAEIGSYNEDGDGRDAPVARETRVRVPAAARALRRVAAAGLALLVAGCASKGDGGSPASGEAVGRVSSSNLCPRCIASYEVVTHHYDNQRHGVQAFESKLTPSNVGNVVFRNAFNLISGQANPPRNQSLGRYSNQVSVQPLYARAITINNTVQDAVFVEDSFNYIYYLTPDLALIPAPAGSANPLQLEAALNPGIMGTPVIDEAHDRMYVVDRSTDASTCPGSLASTSHYLHVIDLNTMKDGQPRQQICASATNGSVTNVFNSDREMQRPALLLNGNYLYVSFGADVTGRAVDGEGGTCVHGWVLTYDVTHDPPALVTAYVTSRFADTPNCPNQIQTDNSGAQVGWAGNAGLWMGGAGPAADANGNVYVMTANGLSDSANDSQALIQLSASGNMVARRVAPNANFITGADLDLSSSGPVVVDTVHQRVITSGKEGVVDAISVDSMTATPNSGARVGKPDFIQITTANCSTTGCDSNGAPVGGSSLCCPYGCDVPGGTAFDVWNLIQNKVPGKPQPLCGSAIENYHVGTWSLPVVWNNRVYFSPQSDYVTYRTWDPNVHDFAASAPVTVSNFRLPYTNSANGAICTLGESGCAPGPIGHMTLSVNGAETSSAILWVAAMNGLNSYGDQVGVFYAFDANATNAPPKWTWANTGLWTNHTYPVVANGRMYVMNAGYHNAQGYWPPQLLEYY